MWFFLFVRGFGRGGGGVSLVLFSNREVCSACGSEGKSPVVFAGGMCRSVLLQRAQLCVSGFAVSVQKAGAEVGEAGIEGMAEAPSLAPACVLCLSHPRCAVRVMPAQRNMFGHHSNFWFLISAASLQELL